MLPRQSATKAERRRALDGFFIAKPLLPGNMAKKRARPARDGNCEKDPNTARYAAIAAECTQGCGAFGTISPEKAHRHRHRRISYSDTDTHETNAQAHTFFAVEFIILNAFPIPPGPPPPLAPAIVERDISTSPMSAYGKILLSDASKIFS